MTKRPEADTGNRNTPDWEERELAKTLWLSRATSKTTAPDTGLLSLSVTTVPLTDCVAASRGTRLANAITNSIRSCADLRSSVDNVTKRAISHCGCARSYRRSQKNRVEQAASNH